MALKRNWLLLGLALGLAAPVPIVLRAQTADAQTADAQTADAQTADAQTADAQTADAQTADECAVPADLVATDAALPAVEAALHHNEQVRIVAIGGSSTMGAAAGPEGRTYPQQLQANLSAKIRGAFFRVFNKGAHGEPAADMLARFDKDVIAEKPTLVLWETGTVDAVDGIDLDEFAAVLQAGIDKLREHHIDVILIGPQYSPATAALINFDPYRAVLLRVAENNGVFLFRRYDMMQYWSDQGVFDFDEVEKERGKFAARVYGCLAVNLAEAIAIASRAISGPTD